MKTRAVILHEGRLGNSMATRELEETRAGEAAETADKKMLVAVLSLSRSGSSLVSRILHEVLGIDFGETIEHIPYNRNNPEGYFENADILRLNEDILSAAGGGVFEPPPLNFFTRGSVDAFDSHLTRIRSTLDFYSINRKRYGFKDPRLSLTFPLWKQVFPHIVPVIAFRDPGAAAASIVEQNGISLDHASSLWFEYYYRIFHYTAGMRRFVVSFERLLKSPNDVVLELASHLGIDLDAANVKGRVDAIVKPGASRHSARSEPVEFSPYIDARTKLVYQYLRRVTDEGAQPAFGYLGAMMAGLYQHSLLTAAAREAPPGEGNADAEPERHLSDVTTPFLADGALAAIEAERQLKYELAAVQEELAEARKAMIGLRAERLRLVSANDAAHAAEKAVRLGAELDAITKAHAEAQATLKQHEQALLDSRGRLESLEGTLQEVRALQAEREARLERLTHELETERTALVLARRESEAWQRCGEAAIRELEAFRQRRSVRFVNRLLDRSDAWNDVGPPFQQLKDDSAILGRGLRGFRLRPSANLQSVPFVGYRMHLDRPGLSGLLFGAILDAPQREGYMGVEIVSVAGRILVQSVIPMSQVPDSGPVAFDFPPLPAQGGAAYTLRVFCRGVQLPVRVFELRWHGLDWPRRYFVQPFCGFVFAAASGGPK